MSEYAMYCMGLMSFGVGMWAVIFSLLRGHSLATVAGAAVAWLAKPAFQSVREIRRENQNLRLLEIALASAKTAEQAAAAVLKMYTKGAFGSSRGRK